MPEFGPRLKRIREEQGIALRQIATATKISVFVLEALERDDFARLPGGIFGRAFVREYAIEVGLDPDETVREFLVELERSQLQAARARPRPEITEDDRQFLERQRRAALVLRIAGITLLVLLVALVLWWQFRPAQDDGAEPPAASATAKSPEATSGPPPAPLGAGPPVDTRAATTAAGAEPPSELAASPEPGAPPAVAPLAVHLDVTGECWVRVTSDSRVIFEEVLSAGASKDFQATREMYLQVGNGGMVTWRINGEKARPIGGPGRPGYVTITLANYRSLIDGTAS